MDKMTAIIVTAVFTATVGFCAWLVKRLLTKTENDIANINKNLTNHITDTQKEIKGLIKGQAELEVKIAEGQAKLEKGQANLEVKNAERHAELEKGQANLEVKNAERHAELYKLLSSKSLDKKQ